MSTDPDQIELAYLAGWLDGEGCFLYGTTPRVSASNTYPPVLVRLSEVFGGAVSKTKPSRYTAHRTCWQWSVTGPNALRLVEALLPYLREKRDQASLLPRIRELKKGDRGPLLQELRDLKHMDHATGEVLRKEDR